MVIASIMTNNMKYFSVVGVLALAGIGVYIWAMQNQLTTTPNPNINSNQVNASATPISESSSSAMMAGEKVVVLAAQSESSQSGKVTFKEIDGKTMVSIMLDNGPSTPQPAHIHLGACPAPGAVKYPLTNVVNGKSETTIDATIKDLLTQLPLAVNVHKSVAESKTYVACGDIK
jgi:hypothetical protein